MNDMSIVRDDFNHVARSVAGLVLIFLTPLVILLIAPAERSASAVRILVAGPSPDPRTADRLVQVMSEASQIKIAGRLRNTERDPLKRIKDDHLDILLNYEKYEHEDFRLTMYTAETDPARLAELESLGAGILRAEAFINQRQRLESSPKKSSQPLFEANVWWARPALYEDLYMLGALPVQPLTEYFPQAADPRVAMFPTLIILLSSLLPFALAIGNETHRQPDVSAGWMQIATRTAAHAVVPAAMTALASIMLLLLAEFVLDVQIKAGVFRMLLLMLPALLATAFAAFAAVRMSRSGTELATWCTLYVLLVVVLVSGVPLIERHPWVRAVSLLLPATHLKPILSAWLFGAPYDMQALWAAGRMLVLALLFWQAATTVQWLRTRAARKTVWMTSHAVESAATGSHLTARI